MILLDTQLILWWCYSQQCLPKQVIVEIANNQSKLYVSELSLFEIILKKRAGKLNFEKYTNIVDFSNSIQSKGFNLLPIKQHHFVQHETLEKHKHHKDPYDQLLIAQSRAESMRFLTSDKLLKDYGAEYYPRRK